MSCFAKPASTRIGVLSRQLPRERSQAAKLQPQHLLSLVSLIDRIAFRKRTPLQFSTDTINTFVTEKVTCSTHSVHCRQQSYIAEQALQSVQQYCAFSLIGKQSAGKFLYARCAFCLWNLKKRRYKRSMPSPKRGAPHIDLLFSSKATQQKQHHSQDPIRRGTHASYKIYNQETP